MPALAGNFGILRGTSIALSIFWMFAERFFSIALLGFAGLLCLFGVGMLVDGIIRLVVTGLPHKRAPQRDARQYQKNKEENGKEIAA